MQLWPRRFSSFSDCSHGRTRGIQSITKQNPISEAYSSRLIHSYSRQPYWPEPSIDLVGSAVSGIMPRSFLE
jgi:hypothetical protein